jgi:hypothetical protein
MARRVDSIQEAPTPEFPPAELDRIYWDELRRMMRGTTRLHGNDLKAFGIAALMHLGPLEGDRRAILGGLLVAEPGGTIGWEREGEATRVAVRGYAPRLPAPLYAIQSRVHVALSRRFFARLSRSSA